jgi:hypothetical protein
MNEAELNRILPATQAALARGGKGQGAHTRGPEAQRLGGPERLLVLDHRPRRTHPRGQVRLRCTFV